jgi:hypothetical protein
MKQLILEAIVYNETKYYLIIFLLSFMFVRCDNAPISSILESTKDYQLCECFCETDGNGHTQGNTVFDGLTVNTALQFNNPISATAPSTDNGQNAQYALYYVNLNKCKSTIKITFNNLEGDIDLILFESGATWGGFPDNNIGKSEGITSQESIEYTSPTGGGYIVMIFKWDGGIQNYQISMTGGKRDIKKIDAGSISYLEYLTKTATEIDGGPKYFYYSIDLGSVPDSSYALTVYNFDQNVGDLQTYIIKNINNCPENNPIITGTTYNFGHREMQFTLNPSDYGNYFWVIKKINGPDQEYKMYYAY